MEIRTRAKIAYTQLYTSSVTMEGLNPRAFVATTAANTCIAQPHCNWVLTIGVPCCVTTLLQKRGRHRFDGMYIVMTDWKLFMKLLLSVVLPPMKPKSDEMHDHDYINTMIKSKSPDKRDTHLQ